VAGREALPEGWFGGQRYEVRGRQDGAERRMKLVPIAEAGQTKAEYEAVFRGFTGSILGQALGMSRGSRIGTGRHLGRGSAPPGR
jgi:hypothetical protein